MSKINKKELSEIDICDLFITPAIKDAGWDQTSQIRCEVTLTPGPIIVRGNMSSRNKKKKKFAGDQRGGKAVCPAQWMEVGKIFGSNARYINRTFWINGS